MGRKKGQGRGEGPSSPRRVLAAERMAKAIALRTAGATFEQIGNELGMSKVGAYKAFQEGMRQTIQEPADEHRRLNYERLQRLLRSVWPAALNGDVKAVGAARDILKDLAKLFGLEAATKHEINGRLSYEQIIAGTFKEEDRIKPLPPDAPEPEEPEEEEAEEQTE